MRRTNQDVAVWDPDSGEHHIVRMVTVNEEGAYFHSSNPVRAGQELVMFFPRRVDGFTGCGIRVRYLDPGGYGVEFLDCGEIASRFGGTLAAHTDVRLD